jgi:hypothetical protein
MRYLRDGPPHRRSILAVGTNGADLELTATGRTHGSQTVAISAGATPVRVKRQEPVRRLMHAILSLFSRVSCNRMFLGLSQEV